MRSAFSDKDPRLDVGICCFSVFAGHRLMWSHYADAHSGVCLMYEIPADYFSRRYPKPSSGSQSAFYLVGASQVFYGDNAFFDWLVSGDLNQPLSGNPIENAVSRIFTSKAMAWDYEEEFRIVTSRPGGLAFESAFLKQMTFGLAVSERSKRLLTGIAKRNNRNIAISSLVRSATSDFGLEFSEP